MTDSSLDDPDARLLARMRLHLVPGVGPIIQQRLLASFGSAENVFEAPAAVLREIDGIGLKLAQAILEAKSSDEAQREISRCKDGGVRILCPEEPGYPQKLLTIPDPPQVLFAKGELLPRDELALAIVGSRRCTVYGQQQAEKLARELALAGVTIVSGLARGIDAAAHRGALAVGGRTIAVLGTGLGNIYPEEHQELALAISKSGSVISESRLDQHPSPGLFPQRNRVISGLSMGVLIVEATRNSGALHTARHAMEQGRDVMAVPGRIDSLASDGCHDLIRDGATLVRHADDVLKSLGPLMSPVRTGSNQEVRSARELSLSEQELVVLNLVTSDPQHLDELLRSTALDPSRTLGTLTVLEMKRLVRRMPGGYFVRAMY